MTKLQRFIPQTPDPYLKQSNQLGAVKFGHLNALVDAINATIYGDYLQLAGDGPMSTTLRALEDPEGNLANLYLATDKTAISGSLKVGNSDPNTGSAILQVDSTTQGVLFPRMTVAERDAIVSPAIGLLIYNTDDLVLNGWDGTEWTEVGGGGGLGLLDDALMTTTLTAVVDKENTASPLKLSTDLVSVGSTLQISTDDTTYIDAEDSLGNNRFTISRVVGQQEVNIDFASNPTLSTKVGAIRTYQDGVNLTDAISVERNGQTTFTERVKVEADSTATTQSTAVIQSSTPNAGIALVTGGAITAHVPDGGGAGGNARGTSAVDLQIHRVGTAATAVASGFGSVLLGGQRSTASGQFSFAMGNTNTASGNNSMSIGGSGNIASSTASAVLGGQSNTASTGTHATVVGGSNNVSSGQYSVSGGNGNTASGSSSVAFGQGSAASGSNSFTFGSATTRATKSGSIALGVGCKADGDASKGLTSNSTLNGAYSSAIGGYDHTVNGQGSVAIGLIHSTQSAATGSVVVGISGNAYLYNQFVHGGADDFSRNAQNSTLNARRFTTLNSASTTVLSLDGTGITNLIIPNGNNRAWNVKVETIAVVTGTSGTTDGVSVGDSLMQDDTILFTRVSGLSSVVGVNNTNIIASTSMGTAGMSFTAGASQELAITFTAPTFTGGGSVTCRVVSKVSLVEVAW